MRPILPNLAELPDKDWVEAVQIIRSSSQSEAPHVHLFPKPPKNELKCCIRMESPTRKVDSTKCADFDNTVNANIAQLEGDVEPNYTYADISTIFENDVTEFGDAISYGFTVDNDLVSQTLLTSRASCFGRASWGQLEHSRCR